MQRQLSACSYAATQERSPQEAQSDPALRGWWPPLPMYESTCASRRLIPGLVAAEKGIQCHHIQCPVQQCREELGLRSRNSDEPEAKSILFFALMRHQYGDMLNFGCSRVVRGQFHCAGARQYSMGVCHDEVHRWTIADPAERRKGISLAPDGEVSALMDMAAAAFASSERVWWMFASVVSNGDMIPLGHRI